MAKGLVSYQRSGDIYFEGSLVATTDASGNVTGTNVLSPYGETISSNTGDPYVYADLYQDTEYGGDASWFRNYSTEQLRWTRPDPYNGSYDVTNPQSMNRYVYAMDNPLNNIDPSGLQDENGTIIATGGDSDGDTWTTFGFPDGSTITIYTLQPPSTTVYVNDGYTDIGTWGTTLGGYGNIGGFGITRTFVTYSPPNNGAQPPDKKQRQDQCVAQVRKNAQNTRSIIEGAGGLTLENTTAACLFAGPGAPDCAAAADTVVLINTGFILAGEWYNENQEEAACAQEW
ncbi:MAG: RHS repeat-associated core domain-containing protein [Acidobacteriaceae bacterium]